MRLRIHIDWAGFWKEFWEDLSWPGMRMCAAGYACGLALVWVLGEPTGSEAGGVEGQIRAAAALLAITYVGASMALLVSLREDFMWLWWFGHLPVFFADYCLVGLGYSRPIVPSWLFILIGPILLGARTAAIDQSRASAAQYPDSSIPGTIYRLRSTPLVVQFGILAWWLSASRLPGWTVVASVYALAAAAALFGMIRETKWYRWTDGDGRSET